MRDTITVAQQMSTSYPSFLPWKITIQKVRKISGGLPCLTEFKLQRVSYYSYPVSFFQSPRFITCQGSPFYIQSCDSQSLWAGRSQLPGSWTKGPRPALLRTLLWWDSGNSLTWPLQSFPWEPSPPPSTCCFTLYAEAPHHRHSCPGPTKQSCPHRPEAKACLRGSSPS